MIRLGISACLLGRNVRYDGGHQHDRFLTDTLGRFVTYVPVCPEVECGLSVPREAMRLVGVPEAPRLVTTSTKKDYTGQMQSWAARRVLELEDEGLSGFIFKSKSPSSGMERVKVYSEEGGTPSHNGVGMFARAFMEHFPLLPCEEDGRLHDPGLRENFIERVFVYRAMRFARGDETDLPGFDEGHYVEHANFDERSLADLLTVWVTIRKSTVTFFCTLPEAAWGLAGLANGFRFTVRGLAFAIAGHVEHHRRVIMERYIEHLDIDE